MRHKVYAFDWASTPLGPISGWPISLRTIVEMMLESGFAKAIVWGPELITIYNDAFRPILGSKPEALGRPFSEIWAEAWPEIGPIADFAFQGKSTFIENFPLTINRTGTPEEAYFTFCYSALRGDDGEIAGMMDTVVETTKTVLADRRLKASEERFRAFTTATSDVVYQMSADWKEMRRLEGRGFLADTLTPSVQWQEEYIYPQDVPVVQEAINAAITSKSMFELEHRVRREDGKEGWTLSRAVPVMGEDGEIVEWFGTATDIAERKAAEVQQEVINREMSHRLKNTLAMVQAIAGQTLRTASDRQLVETLEKRIQALSSAHDILFDKYWQKAPIRALIDGTLQRVAPTERLDIDGGDVTVGPKGALSMSLILHELATNCVKYGAWSNDTGRVSISWTVQGIGEDAVFQMTWREVGGPPIDEPERKGFGSKLIRMGLIGSGGVEIAYPKTGFVADMNAPLHQLQHTE